VARTVAELPPGTRITDYISLGVITKTFLVSSIGSVLSKTGTASVRQRDLPAQVVVYYVIALALYMQSSYVSSGCAIHRLVCAWQANRASLRPARGWVGSLCDSCTMSWSSLWRYVVREGLGIGIGGW
jgi:hypothetical protein